MNAGSYILTTKSMFVVAYEIRRQWFILRKSVGPWGKVHGFYIEKWKSCPWCRIPSSEVKGTDGKEDGTCRCKRTDMTIPKFPECHLKRAFLFSAHQSFKDMCLQGQCYSTLSYEKAVIQRILMINNVSSVKSLILTIYMLKLDF